MFTIDTSVWINGDSPTEKNHSFSRIFSDLVGKERSKIVVPTLLRVEIAGTVSRLSGDAGKGESFSQAIFALPYIRWISLDDTMAARSAEIAARHYLRGADAVYAAVAVEYNCVLVSLDNEHLKRLNDAVQVLTPEQALLKSPSEPIHFTSLFPLFK